MTTVVVMMTAVEVAVATMVVVVVTMATVMMEKKKISLGGGGVGGAHLGDTAICLGGPRASERYVRAARKPPRALSDREQRNLADSRRTEKNVPDVGRGSRRRTQMCP
ncbi:unnamed protein product [Lampetra fluviatilis]